MAGTADAEKLQANSYGNNLSVILLNGTLSSSVNNGVNITLYFAPDALELDGLEGITPIIQGLTLTGGNTSIPTPTFMAAANGGNGLVLNPDPNQTGVQDVTAVTGWARFSLDPSATNPTGATSVVVFGPAPEIDPAVVPANYPTDDVAYVLCGNSGPATNYSLAYQYAQLDSAYQSYMTNDAYGGHLSDTFPQQAQNGNLILNVEGSGQTPGTGTAWSLTFGDAGSSYNFGMGYLDGNNYYYFNTSTGYLTTYSQDNLVFPGQLGHIWAVALQYMDYVSNERTYQVFCETLSAP
jgi:hypothetical protein